LDAPKESQIALRELLSHCLRSKRRLEQMGGCIRAHAGRRASDAQHVRGGASKRVVRELGSIA
jgi:hypothetical protein